METSKGLSDGSGTIRFVFQKNHCWIQPMRSCVAKYLHIIKQYANTGDELK